jgi:LAO/AO transport system kinase
MTAPKARLSPEDPRWIERLRSGDRATLARAITLIENEAPAAQAVLRAIFPHVGRAQVVGFTGAPGVGKSSLVNAYIAELRRREKSVGVIAVDPSSPVSGGAILGDRIRMSEHGSDPAVFVRSLAARGHLGGLTRMTARVVDVMDAAARDVVILETVGTGQSEVEIAGIAHSKVLVCAPGLGDEIQAVKAGVLEIADVLVVNRADSPLAEQTVRQLRDALHLSQRPGWQVPVLRTVATTGEGVAELADAVDRHAAQLDPAVRLSAPRLRMRRLIAAAGARHARRRIEALQGAAFDALCDAVLRGELDFEEAARRALDADSGAER